MFITRRKKMLILMFVIQGKCFQGEEKVAK